MRILILTPFALHKIVFNTIKPYCDNKNLVVDDLFIAGEILTHHNKTSVAMETMKIALKTKSPAQIVVGISSKHEKYDKIICYMPDILEAQIDLFNKKQNFLKYEEGLYTTDDAIFLTDNLIDILSYLIDEYGMVTADA